MITIDANFYLAISFLFFSFLGGRLLYKKIIWFLDQRSQKIQDDIRNATTTLKDAQNFFKTAQEKHRKILDHIQSIKIHATFETERLKSDSRQKLEAMMEKSETLMNETIEQAEKMALRDMRVEALEMACETAQKILRFQKKPDLGNHLIDQALDTVEQTFLTASQKTL